MAALDSPAMFIPTGPTPVSAGFPSPAEGYAQKRLDISPQSDLDLFFTVKGDSMEEADIFEGDVLVVDRSIEPVPGHLVVAFFEQRAARKEAFNQGWQCDASGETSKIPAFNVEGGKRSGSLGSRYREVQTPPRLIKAVLFSQSTPKME